MLTNWATYPRVDDGHEGAGQAGGIGAFNERAPAAVGIGGAGPDGDGETAARGRVEKAVEAKGFHRARRACASAALIATTQRIR